MKKYGIEILFVLVTVVWYFLYRGHLFHWEGANLFLISEEYWKRYALRPGGWAEYVGNGMALFFRWKLAGAMMLAFTDVCCAHLVAGIATRLGFRRMAISLGAIGMGGLIALQCNLYFTMGYTLQVVLALALFYGYLNTSRARNRILFFSLGCPLLFFILLPAQGALLYLAFILSEWLVRRKGDRISVWGGFLWICFWGIVPYYWRNMTLIPDWMIYAFSDVFRFTQGQQYLIVGMFGLPVLLLLFSLLRTKRSLFSWGIVSIGGIATCWVLVVSFQGSIEKRLRMLEAIQVGKWEQLESIADGSKEGDEAFLSLITLADAKQGKLPERLFSYPCKNLGALWMPRNLDYFSNLCGAALFHELGILNESLVRMFQAAETTPWSVNLLTLRSMIFLNMEMGNHTLAEKYLGIMKQVPFYGRWVKARQRELQTGVRIRSDYWLQDKPDFFVSGRGFTVNMENIVRAYPENRMAWDYLLCGLLIQKNIPKFYNYFTASPYSQQPLLPKAYEEALLIYAAQRRETCPYPISAERKELLQEYQRGYQQYKDKERVETDFPEKLRNTVWYYFHFVDNRANAKENNKIQESVYEKR